MSNPMIERLENRALLSATSTLEVDKKGKETLTIFASGQITESFDGISATLDLSGQIVAYAQK